MTYYMIEVDLGFDFQCLPHQNKKENSWSMFVSLDNVYSKKKLEGTESKWGEIFLVLNR